MEFFNDITRGDWTREQFADFEKESLVWLENQQQKLVNEFNLGQYERFDVDYQSAKLIYSSGGEPKVIADIQFAGSLATKSDSWLWSWANESTPIHLKQELFRVKEFGEVHKIFPLTRSGTSDIGDTFCYSVTAIAARLLNAKGIYRSPSSIGYVYLILLDVEWA